MLGGWYFTLMFAAIVYLGQLEYFQMVRATGIAPAAKTGRQSSPAGYCYGFFDFS